MDCDPDPWVTLQLPVLLMQSVLSSSSVSAVYCSVFARVSTMLFGLSTSQLELKTSFLSLTLGQAIVIPSKTQEWCSPIACLWLFPFIRQKMKPNLQVTPEEFLRTFLSKPIPRKPLTPLCFGSLLNHSMFVSLMFRGPKRSSDLPKTTQLASREWGVVVCFRDSQIKFWLHSSKILLWNFVYVSFKLLSLVNTWCI